MEYIKRHIQVNEGEKSRNDVLKLVLVVDFYVYRTYVGC